MASGTCGHYQGFVNLSFFICKMGGEPFSQDKCHTKVPGPKRCSLRVSSFFPMASRTPSLSTHCDCESIVWRFSTHKKMRKQNTDIDKPVVMVAAVKAEAILQKLCHREIKPSRTSTPKAPEHRQEAA